MKNKFLVYSLIGLSLFSINTLSLNAAKNNPELHAVINLDEEMAQQTQNTEEVEKILASLPGRLTENFNPEEEKALLENPLVRAIVKASAQMITQDGKNTREEVEKNRAQILASIDQSQKETAKEVKKIAEYGEQQNEEVKQHIALEHKKLEKAIKQHVTEHSYNGTEWQRDALLCSGLTYLLLSNMIAPWLPFPLSYLSFPCAIAAGLRNEYVKKYCEQKLKEATLKCLPFFSISQSNTQSDSSNQAKTS